MSEKRRLLDRGIGDVIPKADNIQQKGFIYNICKYSYYAKDIGSNFLL